MVLQLGATPLHRAAGAGQLAATEVLLTEGKSKINVKDKHGETPLFLAAASGHEEVGVLNFERFFNEPLKQRNLGASRLVTV